MTETTTGWVAVRVRPHILPSPPKGIDITLAAETILWIWDELVIPPPEPWFTPGCECPPESQWEN